MTSDHSTQGKEPQDTRPREAPLRILVVDDDAFDRTAVRRSLLQRGMAMEVDDVALASDAFARIAETSYDVVLLDYYLPGIDGLATLKRLREAAPDTPVVMLTGRGDEEVAVELMKGGAADYLPKASLTPERLASSLRHALQIARAASARRRAEDELRVQEARYRTMINAIPQLAWMADAGGNIYWFNQRWYDYTGASFTAMPASGSQTFVHPEHAERVAKRFHESFASGEPWEDTFPLLGRNGEYRWFLSRAVPIRDSADAIVSWFGTNTDVTHRLEIEQALRARESDLRDALWLRDEMIAVVAHDLRNPVHTIAMSASTILELPLDEAQQVRHLAMIRRAARGMERLISDLLDVSRIESRQLSIRLAPVPVRALLDETLELFEPQARERDVRLVCALGEELPPAAGDRDRLAQVLSNLIGNALQFTPPKGEVRLNARQREDRIEFTVEDTGSGISPEHLPSVFNRFWQGERETRTGAGLGLTIAKGIVEAHGGEIWVESTPGEGTTFHFTIPYPREHREAAAASISS
jgi:PAS domain S-box-containing protein